MTAQDTESTPVVFRVEKRGPFRDEITAVFPTLPADAHRNNMICYAHIGQHGSCSWGWYCKTRAARSEEYADLLRELESIGYRVDVKCRISAAMRAQLRREVRS